METSMAPTQPPTAFRSLQQAMRQHPLLFFFLIAYAFSWFLTIPVILAEWHILPKTGFTFNFFFVVKSFGPAVAAYVMTHVLEGKAGWHQLASGVWRWRVGWRWYLVILFGVPTMLLLGIVVLPGAMASFAGFPRYFLVTYLVSFVVIFFGGGPLGEEPGWRGFALPRMQARYGALRATLLLGLLWAFWHLPDFLTSAQRGGPGANLSLLYTNLPIFLLMVMAFSIIFTWFYNRTRESIFIAILLHTSINAFGTVQPLFSAPIVTTTDLPFLIGGGIPAILVLVLTHGRLGYSPSQQQPQTSDDVGKGLARGI